MGTTVDDLSLLPPLPLPSEVAPLLDADVTSHILDFLDDFSFMRASAVSRAFRDAIIPRQRNVTISGFPSYERMKQLDFSGAVFFSGRLCELVTNDVLADLATSFPRLKRVDLSGCRKISVTGVRSLVEGMGTRLEYLALRHVENDLACSEPPLQPLSLTRILSSAPSLQSLSLVLSDECTEESLQPLNGKTSLCTLKVQFEGRHASFSLPANLPNLKHLEILTEFHSAFDWRELMRVDYPSLTSMVITDWQGGGLVIPRELTLSAESLIALLSKAPRMKSLTTRKISQGSTFYRELEDQKQLLLAFLNERDIELFGPDGSRSAANFFRLAR